MTVKVFGQMIKIRSDSGDRYVRELVDFLETTIQQILDRSPELARDRIAIMAALQITDAYFQLKQKVEGKEASEKSVKELVAGLIAASDALLEDLAPENPLQCS